MVNSAATRNKHWHTDKDKEKPHEAEQFFPSRSRFVCAEHGPQSTALGVSTSWQWHGRCQKHTKTLSCWRLFGNICGELLSIRTYIRTTELVLIRIFTAFLSYLSSFLAPLICFPRKNWKKNDANVWCKRCDPKSLTNTGTLRLSVSTAAMTCTSAEGVFICLCIDGTKQAKKDISRNAQVGNECKRERERERKRKHRKQQSSSCTLVCAEKSPFFFNSLATLATQIGLWILSAHRLQSHDATLHRAADWLRFQIFTVAEEWRRISIDGAWWRFLDSLTFPTDTKGQNGHNGTRSGVQKIRKMFSK